MGEEGRKKKKKRKTGTELGDSERTVEIVSREPRVYQDDAKTSNEFVPFDYSQTDYRTVSSKCSIFLMLLWMILWFVLEIRNNHHDLIHNSLEIRELKNDRRE